MSEKQFQVIVSGVLVEGADATQVQARVAKLFKTDVSKVAALFSGKRVTIKKGLVEAAALKYKMALKQCGLTAAVTEMVVSTATPETAGEAQIDIAPPGVILDKSAPPKAPDIDTSTLAMEQVGIELDETPRPTEPLIDISAMAMEHVGIELDETPRPEPLDIDVSAISMDKEWTQLDESLPPADPEIDISTMSMSEVGSELDRTPPPVEPDIDISKLSLDS